MERLLLKMPSANRASDTPALLPEGISVSAEASDQSLDISKANESVLIWFPSLMHFYVKGPKCSFNSSGPVGEAEDSLLSGFFQASLQGSLTAPAL